MLMVVVFKVLSVVWLMKSSGLTNYMCRMSGTDPFEILSGLSKLIYSFIEV